MKLRHGEKQSELGPLPKTWSVARLRDCCSKITDGTHDTPTPVATGVPFLTAIHVKDNSIDFDSCLYLTKADHDVIYARCNPQRNDVLMVNIGAGVATTALVDVNYEFSLKNVAMLKPKVRELVGAYLNYCLARLKPAITSALSSGGAQPFLSLAQIGEIQIPLPPLPEQKAIAAALSDVDALLGALDRLISKKRDLKQAAIQRLLTGQIRLPSFSSKWKTKHLDELATFHKGKGLPKSALTPDGTEPCVHYGELFTEYGVCIRETRSRTNKFQSDFRSIRNDVLMPTSDVTPRGLAKASCVTLDGVVLGGDILVIRTDPAVVSGTFLSHVIRMGEAQVLRLVTGTTVFHLYAGDMKKFSFSLPPLGEQLAIVEALADMDAELMLLAQRRDKTRRLKQGMMQELLTGRTRLV